MPQTMKEAIIHAGPKVEIRDVPIPEPGPRQVVIKVVYSGSNPKDWKIPELAERYKGSESDDPMVKFIASQPSLNQGDDIAGIVHSVGADVTEFKPGDRVAAFHEMMTPGGSYAEYALAWDHTTFFLPKDTSFEGGATIPLAAMTAAIGLFASDRLALPTPINPATEPIPLVVYGGASAVGAFAIQLAQRSNIHPIIAVAGGGATLVEKYLDRSKGDTIVDYRQGNDAVVSGIKAALKGKPLRHAYDAVSEVEKGSVGNLSKVLDPQGSKATFVLPLSEQPAAGITASNTNVGDAHKAQKDLAFVFFRLITRGLEEGWFKPHPHEVIPGGLGGVQEALTKLKEGKASAIKYVFEIADTQGL
ncbi:GroES-like protein [Dissoconium aciculare CBS 342.82]|uniref:GroES-like protein n=1 Tax=Dissoconium aciculare CBS 342.82 TaxID=1314786 RepID=A0A6J3MB23_9PEZI|nr:GroES-like protein [Dissoconium aciculare CBS 342.82]KAF1825221.1 GroES-like protein [Dissoconium aciculare CBS 342.82]